MLSAAWLPIAGPAGGHRHAGGFRSDGTTRTGRLLEELVQQTDLGLVHVHLAQEVEERLRSAAPIGQPQLFAGNCPSLLATMFAESVATPAL